ncbi:hypothetical protein CLV49_2709 [Labedella gwakjiensis]|uniref:DUF917 family protein n=1 Tax=Labedella gwakjiensis TaxID=390269 RepID=A0A2P8GYP3_9MICO|nr:DUF917 domain-containing protein [Labedella gwakjiensis]PSL39077.1 hypothetical protein CLV49_2709 [Labedella gwakjiensis]
MVTIVAQQDLRTLGRGFCALGSGGGGRTTMWELVLARAAIWPIEVADVDEVPADTPCVAVAHGGSTLLLEERIVGDAPFAELVDAAERWTGVRATAVCAIEGAGLNGLAPFSLAPALTVVDADLMGRALPRLDQLTLLVDRVPGVVVVCSTGAGVAIVDSRRAADVESVVRSAIVEAGGMTAVLVAGFTVGDLREHAVLGGLRRAAAVGSAFDDREAAQSIADLGERLDGRLLGRGRVAGVEASPTDPFASTIEIRGDDGSILRVVARSESLAVLRDGRVEAATPEILLTVDSISREILQVEDIVYGRHVAVFSLGPPSWWTRTPERLAHVAPAAYGVPDLEEAR